MTLKTIFDRLTAIDHQIQPLARVLDIDRDCEPWDNIALNKSDPEEMFLYNKLHALTTPFFRIHQELTYLHLPCTSPHALRLFPNGRYGYDGQLPAQARTLSCGTTIEALIRTADGHPLWVCSRIEHDGTDYYLYGYRDISLDGLVIRERRYPV